MKGQFLVIFMLRLTIYCLEAELLADLAHRDHKVMNAYLLNFLTDITRPYIIKPYLLD